MVLFRSIICSVLATAALATPVAKRQARTKLDTSIYPTIVKYGEFGEAADSEVCTVPPYDSVVLNYLEVEATDTQATVFRLDSTKEIIIAFRATTSLADFLTDITFIPLIYHEKGCKLCTAHAGFYNAYMSIQPQAKAALTAALAANPEYTTTIIGYSLGGALAYLAYADMFPETQYKVTKAWTYGAPRVGNYAFASYINSLSGATDTNLGTFIRVTHANDGVPLLPPPLLANFWHAKTELWVNNNASGLPSAATAYRCYGNEPSDCINAQLGLGINEAHLSYPGINSTTACTTAQG